MLASFFNAITKARYSFPIGLFYFYHRKLK